MYILCMYVVCKYVCMFLHKRGLRAVCHLAGHCVGLLSGSHSCRRWRQWAEVSHQLCHSLRFHTQQPSLCFRCHVFTSLHKNTAFVLQEMTTGVSGWTERRGRWDSREGSEIDWPLRGCTSTSWYCNTSVRNRDSPCSSSWLSLFLLLGIPGRRPQEVHRCHGIGPSPGGEPFSSRVPEFRISGLCEHGEDWCLSGQHLRRQSP